MFHDKRGVTFDDSGGHEFTYCFVNATTFISEDSNTEISLAYLIACGHSFGDTSHKTFGLVRACPFGRYTLSFGPFFSLG